ncbi:hypothetical protein NDU88_006252 [Pleurodeles waltl]|uniref:Uncharacterized protein n=1 Tax=Pleurodeles waltl TaxID=8319 RepID=A0AAV7LQB8_PLEWA|nr:hypothetical protein NDU88_006252 [Pleurodeles waltl]
MRVSICVSADVAVDVPRPRAVEQNKKGSGCRVVPKVLGVFSPRYRNATPVVLLCLPIIYSLLLHVVPRIIGTTVPSRCYGVRPDARLCQKKCLWYALYGWSKARVLVVGPEEALVHPGLRAFLAQTAGRWNLVPSARTIDDSRVVCAARDLTFGGKEGPFCPVSTTMKAAARCNPAVCAPLVCGQSPSTGSGVSARAHRPSIPVPRRSCPSPGCPLPGPSTSARPDTPSLCSLATLGAGARIQDACGSARVAPPGPLNSTSCGSPARRVSKRPEHLQLRPAPVLQSTSHVCSTLAALGPCERYPARWLLLMKGGGVSRLEATQLHWLR